MTTGAAGRRAGKLLVRGGPQTLTIPFNNDLESFNNNYSNWPESVIENVKIF